jgi:hypothetical protein
MILRGRGLLALFQIYRLSIDNKFSFFEFIDNHVEGSLFVIKINNQQIMSFILIFRHAVNFFQDRTYPGVGVSGGTAGYG